MHFSGKRRSVLAATVVAAAVTAGGLAYASIPDSTGVIHGCYNPNGATATNGTQLNIINRDVSSCGKSQQEITWGQTGPQGAPGTSVTSTALSPGDAHCPAGGSQFTAAGPNVTYACSGAKGDKGDTGATGPSNAYTNYGDGVHTIAKGDTQTVASVTIPAGSYVLWGTASVASTIDNTHGQCRFESSGVLGQQALASLEDGVTQVRVPVLADITITSTNGVVFLRCQAIDDEITAVGEMIAMKVGSVTASE